MDKIESALLGEPETKIAFEYIMNTLKTLDLSQMTSKDIVLISMFTILMTTDAIKKTNKRLTIDSMFGKQA
jgi:hypothetical protein